MNEEVTLWGLFMVVGVVAQPKFPPLAQDVFKYNLSELASPCLKILKTVFAHPEIVKVFIEIKADVPDEYLNMRESVVLKCNVDRATYEKTMQEGLLDEEALRKFNLKLNPIIINPYK